MPLPGCGAAVFLLLLKLMLVFHSVHGLVGPNVCFEQQNYTLTTRVKYQQPVSVRTYSWCFDFPPKCSSVHTEMREKWKVQTVVRTKTVEICCEGFEEQEDMCTPKCPAGLTGDVCDKVCPPERWGISCYQKCFCPDNSVCDARNGKCVCLEGWLGPSCDIPRDSVSRMPSQRINQYIHRTTKPFFDWSSPTRAPTEAPRTTKYSVISDSEKPKTLQTSTSLPRIPIWNNNKKINETKLESSTMNIRMSYKAKESQKPTKTPIIFYTSPISTRTLVNTSKIQESNATKKYIEMTTSISKPTSPKDVKSISTTSFPIFLNNTTKKTTEVTTEKTTSVTQIESPTASKGLQTTASSEVKKLNITTETSEIKTTESTIISLTILKPTVSTAKKKLIKPHKHESEILNITLKSVGNNQTNSKIFKTVTVSPLANTTIKTQPKGKIYHESKMITIPVRVIMDSANVPSNIYSKKQPARNVSSITSRIDNRQKSFKSLSGSVFILNNVTLSPMITTDIHTEETKHVLTEPEQITSIAGSDDDYDRKDDLFSILSIAIGVAVALILTATIIVLITRYRQIQIERLKKLEMQHVESMMNVSEDEVQSSYLRSVFHSPLPDPPSQIVPINNKSRFSGPFMQPVVISTISPAMMENFRDILECHYDHPKPPRPTSFTPNIKSEYDIPPSTYQPLNTFTSASQDTNRFENKLREVNFPVTDAAIKVLKHEHQSAQFLNMEHLEPLYDEIPTWLPVTSVRNTSEIRIVTMADEAVTEL